MMQKYFKNAKITAGALRIPKKKVLNLWESCKRVRERYDRHNGHFYGES